MLRHYFHIMFFPHDVTYFVKSTSPSCSETATPDASTTILHSCGAVVRDETFPLFPSNVTEVVLIVFCFIWDWVAGAADLVDGDAQETPRLPSPQTPMRSQAS
ncbi:hypothetical protein ATANTOWER_007721 [Ataeniobius toweri]|uniref:Uncharacterized protein n=1 Tax=Ataeniobius toweri TaxID=208326 RepID=A0ABU7AZ06_9TELE|nr:hypothetical protein [Ataeniobius toweri]